MLSSSSFFFFFFFVFLFLLLVVVVLLLLFALASVCDMRCWVPRSRVSRDWHDIVVVITTVAPLHSTTNHRPFQ